MTSPSFLGTVVVEVKVVIKVETLLAAPLVHCTKYCHGEERSRTCFKNVFWAENTPLLFARSSREFRPNRQPGWHSVAPSKISSVKRW